MKLSVVIPLYNKEKYIDRCLKSLLIQDLPSSEYEIIIVDDGSTDSSCSIVQEYEDKYENVYLYRQKNGGAGAARNNGLSKSRGVYVYFLDADDYIVSNVLKLLLGLAEKNDLEILGFNTKYVSDGSHTDSSTKNIKDLTVEVMDGMSFIANRGFRNEAWWYIIKKRFLLDTGIKFTEGRYLQDSIFSATLMLKTKRIDKVNLDVHRFVQVENSATTNKNPAHLLKFIDDIVYALGKIDELVKGLDKSDENYEKVFKVYKQKQQSFVFTLIIKSFRCSILKIKDLNNILQKLEKIDVYPIDVKLGGIGYSKTRFVYNNFVIPLFNNKPLLFLSLRLKRLISN
jgi:glycosyltransferase involved in cell wall biosynthesis